MSHYSVLLTEAVDLLQVRTDGVYLDGTFGRGGHSLQILKRLGTKGQLIVCDKDPDAVKHALTSSELSEFRDSVSSVGSASSLVYEDEVATQGFVRLGAKFSLVHDSFASIKNYLTPLGVSKLDGILLDLGVSSPQLDDETRGFSFRFDSPLDMRMDNTRGLSARDLINEIDESTLADIIWRYGEERFAKRIAANVVKARQNAPITTTLELARIVEQSVPFKEIGQHPATRTFQALRIYINNELEDLENFLASIPEILNIGGRVVVISFHSLEDKLVKAKFNELSKPIQLPKWIQVMDQQVKYKVIAKKVRASFDEIEENKRSRSAIMRCLERIQ
jgi:16S rRNA (cytosine1402-N4)-methyltransferase